jgi:hypothetical protein
MMVSVACLYLIGCVLLIFHTTRLAGILLLSGLILLHLAELKTAIRIGHEQGVSISRIVFMDMIFGFTWWLPLKSEIIN